MSRKHALHSKLDLADFDRVYGLIMAGWASQVVRALAALSVAEHLAGGPLGAAELARREHCRPEAMYRLLRAAGSLDLVHYDSSTDAFAATRALRVLDAHAPLSLKDYALAAIGPAFWLPALHLADAVRDGRPHAEDALGSDVFGWMADHPEEAARFSAAMSGLSEPIISQAVEHIDLGGVETIVDVGGAEGAFLAALLAGDDHPSGAVLELEHVVPAVDAEARRRGLSDRMRGVAGDFREAVPPADLYLLKFILHDWDDVSNGAILASVRAAMRPGARVIVVEMAAESQPAPLALSTMDMAMLFSTGGQERELGQFRVLLEQAGLTRVTATALAAPYYLIEASV